MSFRGLLANSFREDHPGPVLTRPGWALVSFLAVSGSVLQSMACTVVLFGFKCGDHDLVDVMAAHVEKGRSALGGSLAEPRQTRGRVLFPTVHLSRESLGHRELLRGQRFTRVSEAWSGASFRLGVASSHFLVKRATPRSSTQNTCTPFLPSSCFALWLEWERTVKIGAVWLVGAAPGSLGPRLRRSVGPAFHVLSRTSVRSVIFRV